MAGARRRMSIRMSYSILLGEILLMNMGLIVMNIGLDSNWLMNMGIWLPAGVPFCPRMITRK